MSKVVLVTGGAGYAGTYLVRQLIESRSCNLLLLFEDLTTDGFVIPEADVVVHLAGRPNSFKGDPAEIYNTNFQGTVNLARKCPEGVHFVFLSSDYVFKSHSSKAYKENDPTDPETVYGRAKAQAEEFLLENYSHSTVLRTSMLYGYSHPHRKNFFKLVEEKLAQGHPLDLFTNVYSQPTYIADLCTVVMKVIENQIYGVYHACGTELISRYELGKLICEVKGYDQNLIIPVSKPDIVKIPTRIELQPSLIFLSELKTGIREGVRLWQ